MRIAQKLMALLFLTLLSTHGFSQNAFKIKDKDPVIAHPSPVAEFTFSGLCRGDTTKFINKSSGASIYNWYIMNSAGDTIDSTFVEISFINDTMTVVRNGDSSFTQYEDFKTANSYGPEYYFESTDSYSVALLADNGHIVEKKLTFLIDTITHAEFSYTECNSTGTAFINKSGCADEFLWIIDGTTEYTTASPEHKFSDTGNHLITLVAINGEKRDSLTREIDLQALGYPTGEFTYYQVEDTVFFLAKDIDGLSFYWDFGDGSTDDSSGVSAYHVYPIPEFSDEGFYTVTLWLNNSCGLGFSSKEIEIKQPVGISNKSNNSEIQLYPNPATDEIQIFWPEKNEYNVSMINLKGEVVWKSNNNLRSGSFIDVRAFVPGLYFLKFTGRSNVVSKKIVIGDL